MLFDHRCKDVHLRATSSASDTSAIAMSVDYVIVLSSRCYAFEMVVVAICIPADDEHEHKRRK